MKTNNLYLREKYGQTSSGCSAVHKLSCPWLQWVEIIFLKEYSNFLAPVLSPHNFNIHIHVNILNRNKNAPLKIILLNCTLGHCVKPPIYDGICFHLKKKLVGISQQ